MHLCPHYCWVIRLITIAFPFPAIKFVVDVEMGIHISNTNNYQSDFLQFHTQWIATITRFMYDRHRPTYINSLFKAEGTHRRNYNVNAHTHFLNFLHTDTIINLRFGQRTITYAQQCTLQVVVRCPHTALWPILVSRIFRKWCACIVGCDCLYREHPTVYREPLTGSVPVRMQP